MSRPNYAAAPKTLWPSAPDSLGGPPASAADADLLQQGAQFLGKHVKLLAAALVLGLFAGFVFYVYQPRTYRALATLELLGLNEALVGMSTLDPQAGTGTYSANSVNLQTQLKLVESAGLRRIVYDRVRMQKLPDLPPPVGIVEKIRRRIGVVPSRRNDYIDQALFMATNTVTGGALPGTRIMVVGCESTNPEVAASYVNELTAQYIDQSVQVRSGNTLKTGEWLRSELASAKTKLGEAEAHEQAFVRTYGGTYGSEPDTLDSTKLRQLQMDLSTIQAERISKQTRFDALKNAPADALPDAQESAVVATYQVKIGDLRRERAALLTSLTPENSRVKYLDAQIADLQVSVRAERQTVLQRAKADYENALHREQLLSSAFSRQSSAITSQSSRAAQHGMLKREIDMLRQSVNMLAQQANQSAVVSAVPMANVRVVDSADVPTSPIKPSLIGEMRFGVSVSLILGVCLAFATDKLQAGRKQRRFSVPGIAPSLLQVPELGVIPAAGSPKLPAPRSALGTLELSTPKDGDDFWTLGATLTERALLADAIQNVVVSILHQGDNGWPKVIVAASPGPEEGKTTIACSLAAAMAESGRRVLLIDADLRRPRVHDLLHLDKTPGLADLLRESGQPDAFKLRFIQASSIPGLSVLSSGACDSQEIRHLFLAANFGKTIQHWRTSFDLIVIDTPPLLQFAESRILGRYSDGVLLVLRSQVTEHKAALACQRALDDDKIPLLGTILNHWNPEGEHRKYYAQYYRH